MLCQNPYDAASTTACCVETGPAPAANRILSHDFVYVFNAIWK